MLVKVSLASASTCSDASVKNLKDSAAGLLHMLFKNVAVRLFNAGACLLVHVNSGF
jgi:hypothetical protein